MSKVTYHIIFGLLVLMMFILNPLYTSAIDIDSCPLETNPATILDDVRQATFTINVGKFKGYPNYTMEFECGAPHYEKTVTANSEHKISAALDRTGVNISPPCEFMKGDNKTIKVKVDQAPQCIATYKVYPSKPNCTLKIVPSTDITSATPLTVNVEGLHAVEYRLLIDNSEIKGGYVTSPDFSVPVPQKRMTPGSHIIELKPGSNVVDSTECSIPFMVGTPKHPGNVLPPGTVKTSQKCKDKEDPTYVEGQDTPCTSGKGIQCGADKDPAIATAIGCVHTSPVGFIQDFLKFVIGISGGLAFLMMLLGAFQMLTSAGNPDTLVAGRDRLTSAVIGLLFVIFAVLLLQIIGVDILFKELPGFGR